MARGSSGSTAEVRPLRSGSAGPGDRDLYSPEWLPGSCGALEPGRVAGEPVGERVEGPETVAPGIGGRAREDHLRSPREVANGERLAGGLDPVKNSQGQVQDAEDLAAARAEEGGTQDRLVPLLAWHAVTVA